MLTTNFVPGTPNWLDLGAPDTDAAARFYMTVLSWSYEPLPEAGGYGFFRLDGSTVAALGPLTEEGATAGWTLYFATEDADATADAVRAAGGSVRVEPDDVFTAGRLAAFTDPQGAEFAVWQPRDIGGLEKVMDRGSMCWTELYTTDAGAAKSFYSAVFSWSYDDQEMGGGMTYTLASSPGGGAEGDAAQGGMMTLPKENLDAGSRPEWHPYFCVDDCDATYAAATGNGGSTLVPPVDVPGVGRLAMVRDPAGAVFGIIMGDPNYQL
ncbi:VOC family protein [Streptomyces sp. HNM0574]|uniref:VOC family protein n=1 Tax=Streptomyces sp. HNM0574 TaxID=2714954 RepID=UPI00146B8605|nr:VOC family protein [Streptomyces sp. HNM0574]NLU70842.1 VOC family protein [Streptomyces sp. HNM0574]